MSKAHISKKSLKMIYSIFTLNLLILKKILINYKNQIR